MVTDDKTITNEFNDQPEIGLPADFPKELIGVEHRDRDGETRFYPVFVTEEGDYTLNPNRNHNRYITDQEQIDQIEKQIAEGRTAVPLSMGFGNQEDLHLHTLAQGYREESRKSIQAHFDTVAAASAPLMGDIWSSLSEWFDLLFTALFDPENYELKASVYEFDVNEGGFFDALRDPKRTTSIQDLAEKYYEPGSNKLQAVEELLELIAQGESNGDYNIAYGGQQVDFTSKTINEVLEWQDLNNNAAAGRYQIKPDTMRDMMEKLNLSGDEKFDEAMQDKIAFKLLERRGLLEYANGDISKEQFMENISKEWAALPKDVSGEGYYDNNRVDNANINPHQVSSILDKMGPT